MSIEIPVYNIEGLGPVVSTDAILRVLTSLRDRWVGGEAMIKSIATVVEIEADARSGAPLVRLSPAVPGGGVQPFVTEIEHTWD